MIHVLLLFFLLKIKLSKMYPEYFGGYSYINSNPPPSQLLPHSDDPLIMILYYGSR